MYAVLVLQTCLTVGLLAVVMACSLAFSINLAVHDRIFGVASFACVASLLVLSLDVLDVLELTLLSSFAVPRSPT